MAREFNGTSQYLNHAAALVTAAPFTFGCWFYAGAATGDVLFGVSKNATTHLWWLGTSSSKLQWTARDTGQSTAETSSTFGTGAWHHACVVEQATNARHVYLDGAGKSTNSTVRTPTGVNRTTLGVLPWSSLISYWSGRIALAALWNAALSDAEVAALAAGALPISIRPASLVHFWPLFGAHDPEVDMVGGAAMSLVNAPTVADGPPIPWIGVTGLAEASPTYHRSGLAFSRAVASYRRCALSAERSSRGQRLASGLAFAREARRSSRSALGLSRSVFLISRSALGLERSALHPSGYLVYYRAVGATPWTYVGRVDADADPLQIALPELAEGDYELLFRLQGFHWGEHEYRKRARFTVGAGGAVASLPSVQNLEVTRAASGARLTWLWKEELGTTPPADFAVWTSPTSPVSTAGAPDATVLADGWRRYDARISNPAAFYAAVAARLDAQIGPVAEIHVAAAEAVPAAPSDQSARHEEPSEA
ncbi:MAG: hypothetical protein AMXMBFR7_32820 [Planctomycetota bacterium]